VRRKNAREALGGSRGKGMVEIVSLRHEKKKGEERGQDE